MKSQRYTFDQVREIVPAEKDQALNNIVGGEADALLACYCLGMNSNLGKDFCLCLIPNTNGSENKDKQGTDSLEPDADKKSKP